MYQRNRNYAQRLTQFPSGIATVPTVSQSSAPAQPPQQQVPGQQAMGGFKGQQPQQSQASAPQYVQQPVQQQPSPPPVQNQAPPPTYPDENNGYAGEEDPGPSYPGQICKIGGSGKFFSLHNELVMAATPGSYENDFAAIHGQGGKKHAVRSRIVLRMCDYSRKPSTNVKYNLEPYFVFSLLKIVDSAITGNLVKAPAEAAIYNNAMASGVIAGWLKSKALPSEKDLNGLYKMLTAAPTPEANRWTYHGEKNNPYACKMMDGVNHTPVQSIDIQYDTTRQLQWTITVSNFMAPIIPHQNGTSSHNSKQAKETKKVTIFVTTENLHAALLNATHFINLWEYRTYPMLNAMCKQQEQEAEARHAAARGNY